MTAQKAALVRDHIIENDGAEVALSQQRATDHG
jgi:hypothetical protein